LNKSLHNFWVHALIFTHKNNAHPKKKQHDLFFLEENMMTSNVYCKSYFIEVLNPAENVFDN